jgi:hypothetical protein
LSFFENHSFEDLREWIYYYKRLNDCYHNVIKKTSGDLYFLRQQLVSLERSNAQLRNKMGNFEEKKFHLLQLAKLTEHDRAKVNELFSKYFPIVI